jgi:pilus assembly protein Flp/PilA
VKRARPSLPAGETDRGASAVEYGLMIAAIAAVLVAVVFGLSETFTNAFHDTCTVMEDHNSITVNDSQDC